MHGSRQTGGALYAACIAPPPCLAQPSILFLDEVDALAGPARGSGGSGGGSDDGGASRRLLVELMLLLNDAPAAAPRMLVCAATNRACDLVCMYHALQRLGSGLTQPEPQSCDSFLSPPQDPALLRRFDARIPVFLPSAGDRWAMLTAWLQGIDVDFRGGDDEEVDVEGACSSCASCRLWREDGTAQQQEKEDGCWQAARRGGNRVEATDLTPWQAVSRGDYSANGYCGRDGSGCCDGGSGVADGAGGGLSPREDCVSSAAAPGPGEGMSEVLNRLDGRCCDGSADGGGGDGCCAAGSENSRPLAPPLQQQQQRQQQWQPLVSRSWSACLGGEDVEREGRGVCDDDDAADQRSLCGAASARGEFCHTGDEPPRPEPDTPRFNATCPGGSHTPVTAAAAASLTCQRWLLEATDGWSGADLRLLVTDAAMAPVREAVPKLLLAATAAKASARTAVAAAAAANGPGMPCVATATATASATAAAAASCCEGSTGVAAGAACVLAPSDAAMPGVLPLPAEDMPVSCEERQQQQQQQAVRAAATASASASSSRVCVPPFVLRPVTRSDFAAALSRVRPAGSFFSSV
jgi:hypothetical protein